MLVSLLFIFWSLSLSLFRTSAFIYSLNTKLLVLYFFFFFAMQGIRHLFVGTYQTLLA